MASKRKHGAETGRPPKRPKVLPLLTLESQIKRELRKHLKTLGFRKDGTGALVAPSDTKDAVRNLHSVQRCDLITRNHDFVTRRWPLLQRHFANGNDITPERIAPRLELVASDTWQADLFRMAALSWSVPVSAGYGRRMRWLVWDDANDKLIGLIALGEGRLLHAARRDPADGPHDRPQTRHEHLRPNLRLRRHAHHQPRVHRAVGR
ncbi:MAG: DUF4338 domain-containing protein [Bryobacteraceae bacterium]|nr:DUF4338 domain-containing protein [Bryobacteraceae bacterium]